MLLFEKLVALYAPHRCVECDREGNSLLCDSCRGALSDVPSRCYRCRVTSRGYATCPACCSHSPLGHVYVSQHHADAAKELLHRVKYERAKSGVAEMAELMTSLLHYLPDDVVFVPIPTATSRVRQRGYDQAVVLAKQLAQQSGYPVIEAIARLGQAHQVGSNRKTRLKHLENAFRVIRLASVAGKHVVLIDDVLTTGATAETAARLLKRSGARQVDALIFSQPS